MAPEFVDRTGGSKWQSALPTRRQQVGLGTIVFIVLRRIRELELMAPEFVFYPAEACGCRPCRPGGSMWVSALPTRRQHVAVGTAARGCRLSLYVQSERWPRRRV